MIQVQMLFGVLHRKVSHVDYRMNIIFKIYIYNDAQNFSFVDFFFSVQSIMAQKKPLDHSVYDSWQSIGQKLISNDGKWVVYTIDPQEGDNELVIQQH